MKTVAVTGPICGGKSTLVSLLVERGAVVVDADQLGHEVLTMPDVQRELVAVFGESIRHGRTIDRRVLGGLVFGDRKALATLNRISHPVLARLVDDRLESLAAAGNHALAVLDAAVYFLLPVQTQVDLVVTVTAGQNIRLERLRQRNGLDEGSALSRLRAQGDLVGDWNRADMVVANDRGLSVLEKAATSILETLGLAG